MSNAVSFLREISLWSVVLRLIMALFFGGLIGMERGSRHKAAGFRTYMLVCLGATITMLLGQYQSEMLNMCWAKYANVTGMRTDVTRFSAQVINGIGFLGAGTIIVTGHQAVKGLTTAAALWASACMGIGHWSWILRVCFSWLCSDFFLRTDLEPNRDPSHRKIQIYESVH